MKYIYINYYSSFNLNKKINKQDYVRFEVNAPFELLVSSLGKGKVGLHTMWNEHFGIGVVEYQAAGLIPVAHKSAGPKMDIVIEYDGKPTGNIKKKYIII